MNPKEKVKMWSPGSFCRASPAYTAFLHAHNTSRVNSGSTGQDQQTAVFKRESRTQRQDTTSVLCHSTRSQQQAIRKCPGLRVQSEIEAQIPLYHLWTVLSSSHFFIPLPAFSTLEGQPQNKLCLETA